jgi:TRAP-type C4-dicarboxylate transport system substrate-binding protein
MFAANFNWYQALPDAVKSAFDTASEKTQIETFAQIEKSRAESMKILSAAGVKFYNPTPDEFRQWVETCGEARKEWDEHKIKLAGSIDNFNRFKEAANTKGPITVGDYKG